MRRGVVVCLLATGCHIHRESQTLRPISSERVVSSDGAMPRAPTLIVSDAATLRFVEPLDCPTVEMVTTSTTIETEVAPNLATFVVGVVATAAGGIVTVRGATEDSNALLGAGIGGLAVGVPFMVGPWIGVGTERVEGKPNPPTPRPGPTQACGDRPFAGTTATVQVSGVEVFGSIASDGTFSVSPYELVDAYRTTMLASWDVNAVVQTADGPRTITTVIDSSTLAAHAQKFLAKATSFDATVGPMRVIPGMTAGALRTSLTEVATGPALRIVLPVANAGPGEAWGVRGVIVSSTKAVDGRVIYFGRIAKGQTVNGELIVPLTTAAAATLRGGTIDLSIELRDAHGTAPTTPVRYSGTVLGDLPR